MVPPSLHDPYLHTKPLPFLHLHLLTPLQQRLVHSLFNLLVTHFRSLRLASTLFTYAPAVSSFPPPSNTQPSCEYSPTLVSRRCDCNDRPINSSQRLSIGPLGSLYNRATVPSDSILFPSQRLHSPALTETLPTHILIRLVQYILHIHVFWQDFLSSAAAH